MIEDFFTPSLLASSVKRLAGCVHLASEIGLVPHPPLSTVRAA